MAKLSEADVLKIVELINKGDKDTIIANKFNVSRKAINNIRIGRYWTNITNGLLK